MFITDETISHARLSSQPPESIAPERGMQYTCPPAATDASQSELAHDCADSAAAQGRKVPIASSCDADHGLLETTSAPSPTPAHRDGAGFSLGRREPHCHRPRQVGCRVDEHLTAKCLSGRHRQRHDTVGPHLRLPGPLPGRLRQAQPRRGESKRVTRWRTPKAPRLASRTAYQIPKFEGGITPRGSPRPSTNLTHE